MINCTRLLCEKAGLNDDIRYKAGKPADTNKPIVVWNTTKKCNLRCMHCYINAGKNSDTGELTTQEARAMIGNLAEFGAPVLLFSGGEPLLRQDLYELGRYAASLGLRTVISSNGTLITEEAAKKIFDSGFSYVGISLDGQEATNDKFRKQRGAFKQTLLGIRNCVKNGVRTGLRFTINRHNFKDVAAIFDLIEQEGIPRACFYHLVYSGRAGNMRKDELTHQEARGTMDLIFDRSRRLCDKTAEILTVDNHADGVYLYLRFKKESPQKAKVILDLLKINGGNKSGIGIANVDNLGFVHADQFWGHYSFGNVRERKFSDIWLDESNELLRGLRNRIPLLKGKCGRCNFKELCAGNFRVRAEAVFGDVWQEDPACYLTEEEVTQTFPTCPTFPTA